MLINVSPLWRLWLVAVKMGGNRIRSLVAWEIFLSNICSSIILVAQIINNGMFGKSSELWTHSDSSLILLSGQSAAASTQLVALSPNLKLVSNFICAHTYALKDPTNWVRIGWWWWEPTDIPIKTFTFTCICSSSQNVLHTTIEHHLICVASSCMENF